jgi:hypothetical protein
MENDLKSHNSWVDYTAVYSFFFPKDPKPEGKCPFGF